MFVVETGDGIENANAYITVEWADAYFLDRLGQEWVASIPIKQAAIIKATDYIETRYSTKFLGIRQDVYQTKTVIQGLSWPRCRAFFNGLLLTGVPDLLKRATAEYAVRALTADLVPDITKTDKSKFEVKKTVVTVGPIVTETEYDTGKKQSNFNAYPYADSLLYNLLKTSSLSGTYR
jgi:hypothetical protein